MKGLRHIKTISGIRSARIRLDIQIGSMPRVQRVHRPFARATKRPMKAWVFTKEPLLTRYQPALGGLGVQRVIDPHLDIFSEAETILVIAQIPGAAERNIELEVRDDVLTLEAHASTRMGHVKYYKEVLLPFEVDGSSIQSSFNDGLLQLELKKACPGPAEAKAPREGVRGEKKAEKGHGTSS